MSVSSRTILNVPPLPQKGTKLCWAAAMNIVLNYLENTNVIRQGELCNSLRELWQNIVPGTLRLSAADIAQCNNYVVPNDSGSFISETDTQNWNYTMPLSNLANQQFDVIFLENNYYSVEGPTQLTWDFIKKMIKDFRRPFIMILDNTLIEGFNINAHAVVVRGIWEDNTGNKYLYVNDPLDLDNLSNPQPYSLHFDNLISGTLAVRVHGYVINIISKNNFILKYSRPNQTYILSSNRLPDSALER